MRYCCTTAGRIEVAMVLKIRIERKLMETDDLLLFDLNWNSYILEMVLYHSLDADNGKIFELFAKTMFIRNRLEQMLCNSICPFVNPKLVIS